jgi:formylglycine-generating enzyme required for sulfatase activity
LFEFMDVLGDYTIQKQLGKGAFGSVYLAEHRFIKRPFVLKLLPEEICRDPQFIRRFEEQVAQIAALDHPNIIKIHNVSCFEGSYFIVMDPIVDSFNETMHLSRFLQLKGKFFSEEEKEELLRQVGSALDYAHEAGIVHGSLKLTNILVQSAEKGVRLLLSDFGISRMVGEGIFFLRLCEQMAASIKELDASRHFIESFSFLAPEQKGMDSSHAKKETDAYAFGILSYYVLMNKVPEGCFDLPSKMLPDFKGHWDLLINRCLQNNPSVRPQKLIFAMNEYLKAPKTILKEMLNLAEMETKGDPGLQMAFEFPQKMALARSGSSDPKPILKPQEIVRPEFEADPGAIFQREMQVSHYTPQRVENNQIEPLLAEMVIIPGGSYWRGSSEGSRDEMPRHQIQLASFALDIHPVTNEQFIRFLQVMGGEKDQNNNDIIRLRDARIKRCAGKLTIESGYAKHPVVGVTWYGASAYAKWIGKRLPTEAEWEAAASGGKELFLFPTGPDIERTQANFFSSDTTSVMSYSPNSFGLYDMAGNVYNWCQDWYAYNYYDTSSMEPENPLGPPQGVYRVLRGGCWKSLKDDMRTSHRHRNNPGAVNGTYGFRCATDVL